MRSHNDPPFRAMDEHVSDVSCHPVPAASIGYTIAFPGLKHSHLAKDADRSLIDDVFETVGSPASGRRHDRRLVVGMILKPTLPILSHNASHKRGVLVHVCLAPASNECEKGVTELGLSFWARRGLCRQRPGSRKESE
jgi:hypothetical protein